MHHSKPCNSSYMTQAWARTCINAEMNTLMNAHGKLAEPNLCFGNDGSNKSIKGSLAM